METRSEYKLNVVSVNRPGVNPGSAPMRGADCEAVKDIIDEFGYDTYFMACEIKRLRAALAESEKKAKPLSSRLSVTY
jgi:hypothetical protein